MVNKACARPKEQFAGVLHDPSPSTSACATPPLCLTSLARTHHPTAPTTAGWSSCWCTHPRWCAPFTFHTTSHRPDVHVREHEGLLVHIVHHRCSCPACAHRSRRTSRLKANN